MSFNVVSVSTPFHEFEVSTDTNSNSSSSSNASCSYMSRAMGSVSGTLIYHFEREFVRYLARHLTEKDHPNVLANGTHPGFMNTKMRSEHMSQIVAADFPAKSQCSSH